MQKQYYLTTVTGYYCIYNYNLDIIFESHDEAEAKAKHAELVIAVKQGREDGDTIFAENLTLRDRIQTVQKVYGRISGNGVAVCYDTHYTRGLMCMQWSHFENTFREFPEVIAQARAFLEG